MSGNGYVVTAPVQVSIGQLCTELTKWQNVPEFQREICYDTSRNQKVVDSVLRGLPIGTLTIIRQHGPLGMQYLLMDGQQRVNALVSYWKNLFSTRCNPFVGEVVEPIAPGKKYGELPRDDRDRFDNYMLKCEELINLSPDLAILLFQRSQESLPLNAAEKLWAGADPMLRKAVTRLESHPYFGEIWIQPKRYRRQRCQVIATWLVAYGANGFGDFRRGNWDDLSEDAIDDIKQLADGIVHLFSGYQTKVVMECIPLFQAVWLLRREGCNIFQSEKGCLSGWMAQIKVKAHSNEAGMGVIGRYQSSREQQRFWNCHVNSMLARSGLVMRDPRRSFNQNERLIAYIEQGEVCVDCGRRLRLLETPAHHRIPHSRGGSTNADNCLLLCQKCHDKRTNPDQQIPLVNCTE